MKIAVALRYLSIVFDAIQRGIDPKRLQGSMLNIDSVVIDEVQLAYETLFERDPEDEKSAIISGRDLGKAILLDLLVDERDQKLLRSFRSASVATDYAVNTRIKGIKWGESRTDNENCSWLVLNPQ